MSGGCGANYPLSGSAALLRLSPLVTPRGAREPHAPHGVLTQPSDSRGKANGLGFSLPISVGNGFSPEELL